LPIGVKNDRPQKQRRTAPSGDSRHQSFLSPTPKGKTMLTLETLLSTTELEQFDALVKQATAAGAQAVRWHSQTNGVLVLGICSGGELVTWFASPAHNELEANVVQSVILAGVAQAGATVAALQSGASDIAASAIAKAAGMH
jgi:hypothetical protein